MMSKRIVIDIADDGSVTVQAPSTISPTATSSLAVGSVPDVSGVLTEGEQILYRPNVPNTAIDHNANNGGARMYGASREVTFVPNGIVPLPYLAAAQVRTVMHGCTAGKVTLDMGVIAPSPRVGVCTINVVGANDGDCDGVFSVGVHPGVLVGDEVVQSITGHTATFAFPVGGADPEYPRQFVAGDHMFLVIEFSKAYSDIIIEVAGHLRQG